MHLKQESGLRKSTVYYNEYYSEYNLFSGPWGICILVILLIFAVSKCQVVLSDHHNLLLSELSGKISYFSSVNLLHAPLPFQSYVRVSSKHSCIWD